LRDDSWERNIRALSRLISRAQIIVDNLGTFGGISAYALNDFGGSAEAIKSEGGNSPRRIVGAH